MIMRLLKFRDSITEQVARGMRDVADWHDACDRKPVGIPIDGHVVLRDEDGDMRLIIVAIGGDFGVEFKLDAEDALRLHDSLCRALDEMKGDDIEHFIESLTQEDVQEITDIIGGILSNGTAAES